MKTNINSSELNLKSQVENAGSNDNPKLGTSMGNNVYEVGIDLDAASNTLKGIAIKTIMAQGDDKLQFPMINNLGNEVWKCKEAKMPSDDIMGDATERGILMEAVTAVTLLGAGAGMLVMRHPEAIRQVRSYIAQLGGFEMPKAIVSAAAGAKAARASSAAGRRARPRRTACRAGPDAGRAGAPGGERQRQRGFRVCFRGVPLFRGHFQCLLSARRLSSAAFPGIHIAVPAEHRRTLKGNAVPAAVLQQRHGCYGRTGHSERS